MEQRWFKPKAVRFWSEFPLSLWGPILWLRWKSCTVRYPLSDCWLATWFRSLWVKLFFVSVLVSSLLSMLRVGEKKILQKQNYFWKVKKIPNQALLLGIFFLWLIERVVLSEKAGRGFTSSCVKEWNLKNYSFVVRTNLEKTRALLIDVGLTTLWLVTSSDTRRSWVIKPSSCAWYKSA